jgi:hypothetical protein
VAPTVRAAPAPTLRSGKVLILETERTILGDIDQVDDHFRVRRLSGETLVPASQVLALCASLEDAYRFLRGRANLNDPDERLRLATWCRLNGLPAQALAEVEAAVQMRPGDEALQRLAGRLREAQTRPGKAARPVRPEDGPNPHIDLTADALGLFATRVQPILMNTCASCHIGDRAGAFRLVRTYDSTLANRKTMQQNLAAVLSQVNLHEPALSPLLTKAVSVHAPGMVAAPLRSRELAAYRSLEEWVRRTLASNPQLLERETAMALPAPGSPERDAGRRGQDRSTSPILPSPSIPSNRPAVPTSPVATRAGTPPAPATPAPVPAATTPADKSNGPPAEDPVDPATFNRQFHPERSGGVPSLATSPTPMR